MPRASLNTTEKEGSPESGVGRLRGKRAAVLLFSYYPSDPRPRLAAEALAREGVLIEVVCLQEHLNEPRRATINGVSIRRVGLKRRRSGKLRYITQYSVFILRSFLYLTLRSIVRRYDFVHVHNMPDVLVFSALVPKALGARIILDLHDPMPELMQTIFGLGENSFTVRLLKRFEKWSIKFSNLVLTVNVACRNLYCSRGCPPDKIQVVINAPEEDMFRFQPAATAEVNGARTAKPFLVLYHGALVQRNGFDLAVDALEDAKSAVPDATLMVCGEPNRFFQEVMASVTRRGLNESVKYLGNKTRQEMVEAINDCDLGIIPNHRNTFTEINTPTRIFECLALGKPVIAPRTQGIRDYFDDADLIFFEAGDAHDLAQKIEFAFSNPDEVAAIVERGQQIYLKHTWSREKSGLLNSVAGLF